MLHPNLDGTWLSDIVTGYGDVSYSEDLLHGCQSARWAVPARTRHPLLQAGVVVKICQGSMPVFVGLVSQSGYDGTVEALGYHTRAAGVMAVDGGGNPTNIPRDAVDAAIARGAIPGKRVREIGVAPVGEASGSLTLRQLLDTYSETTTAKWRVNHHGEWEERAPDTTPTWAVMLNSDPWAVTDDDYVTHLNVEYMSGVATYPRFTYSTSESDIAAAKWGRQEASLNLAHLGIITLAAAQAAAAAALAKTGPRMTMTNSVTLSPGQLTTIGDTPAGWSMVHPGQMVRLFGVPDRGSAAWKPYTDMTIGGIERSETTLVLKPLGQAPSNAREAIAALAADDAGTR